MSQKIKQDINLDMQACTCATRWPSLSRRAVIGISTGFLPFPLLGTRAHGSARSRGCSLLAATGSTTLPTFQTSSGSAMIDDFCNTEVTKLNRIFQLNPTFRFFDDGESPNAFAMPKSANPGNADGIILMGKKLSRQLMPDSVPLMRRQLSSVLGHEYGHLLQYKLKFNEAWGVKFELSADYLAGWYLGMTQELSKPEIEETGRLFAGLGDSRFTSQDHHGTPWQRANIFLITQLCPRFAASD
jgi:hypothetical protein